MKKPSYALCLAACLFAAPGASSGGGTGSKVTGRLIFQWDRPVLVVFAGHGLPFQTDYVLITPAAADAAKLDLYLDDYFDTGDPDTVTVAGQVVRDAYDGREYIVVDKVK